MTRLREIRRPWTQQPQGADGIDWANPLTRGLRFAYNPAHALELTRQILPSVDAATTGIGPLGRSHTGKKLQWQTGPILPTAQSTVLAVLALPSLAAWTQVFLFSTGEAWNQYAMFALFHNGSSYSGGFASGSSGTLERVLGITVAELQTPRVLSIRTQGSGTGEQQAHLDGRLTMTTTVGNASAVTPAGSVSGVGYIASSDADAGALYGDMYLVLLWDRALSDDELLSVHRNPWRVLAPRRLWLPTSAAGGSLPTLSAATYMPGSLTSTGFRPRVTAS